MNFGNYSQQMKTTDYNNLAEFTFSSKNFRKIFRKRPEDFSQAINFLISGWTAYRKNINPSVLRIDLPSVGLYVRTLGFIFFGIETVQPVIRDRITTKVMFSQG